MPRTRFLAFVLCLAWSALAAAQAKPVAPKPPSTGPGGGGFRVCADPVNMPFTTQKLEGFENRIADVLAADFAVKPSYIWWGQRQGFIRNTMNATLAEGRCDIVMGVPVGYDLVRTTAPYYRSTYVFVYPRGKYTLNSLDDAILKKLKIGVHLLGNDYENPPPVHELGKRHIVDNVVGFNTFYSADNPPSAIVDAVAAGKIDVAVVWGPPGGYFAARQRTPMDVVPIAASPGSLPMAFDIAMGVRKGDNTLFQRVQQGLTKHRANIDRILKDFNVPVLARKATVTR